MGRSKSAFHGAVFILVIALCLPTVGGDDTREPATREKGKNEMGPYNVGTVDLEVPDAQTEGLMIRVYFPVVNGSDPLEPDMTGAPYPVSIWAPGSGGSGNINASENTATIIASWGVIYVHGTFDVNTDQGHQNGAVDMARVFDLMVDHNRDSTSPFFNMVIEERYGVGGYSNGGMVCFRAAAMDDRVDVLTAMAPAGSVEDIDYSDITADVYIQAGSLDLSFSRTAKNYYDRCLSNKQYILINGGTHGGPYYLSYSASAIRYRIAMDQSHLSYVWGDGLKENFGFMPGQLSQNDYEQDALVSALTASNTALAIGEEVVFSPDEDSIRLILENDDITFWEYDFDGDGTFDWASGIDGTTGTTYNRSGTYLPVLRITGTDAQATSLPMVQLTVGEGAPATDLVVKAEAGNNMSVEVDTDISFDGSASTVNGTREESMEYRWEFGDGQSTEWSNETTVIHRFVSGGNFTVELNVRYQDAIGSDTLTVNVHNPAPTSVFAGGGGTYDEDQEITFSSSARDNPSDLDDLEYRWEFGDGTMSAWSTDSTATHSYSESSPDPYTVTLTVRDSQGGQSRAFTQITIRNIVPICEIIGIGNVEMDGGEVTVEEDELVTLSARVEDSPSDMDGLRYDWDLGEGFSNLPTSVADTTFSFGKSGKETIRLRVIDDDGAESTTSVKLVIKNAAPVAKITINSDSFQVGDQVVLDGSRSTDTPTDLDDGLGYRWNLGPDTLEGERVTYAYDAPGEYTISLTVIDNDGEFSTRSIGISVVLEDGTTETFNGTEYRPGEEGRLDGIVDLGENGPVFCIAGLVILVIVVVIVLFAYFRMEERKGS